MIKKVLMSNYAQQSVSFTHGKGSCLFDTNGKKYLDFACGISVNNLGHDNDYLNKCLMRQSALWHTSNIFPNAVVEKLAYRIVDRTFPGKMFFCNSGAEANEAAIKLARIYNNKNHNGQKRRIITMKDGFHGRTIATLSATAQDKIHKGFEPILDGFTYIEFNNLKMLEAEISKGDVSAVILELYQGESGVLAASNEFIKAVRDLTHKYEALMIIDEVQTGFGRTGKLFAFHHTDIVPDAITMAKAMANGIPMGGILAADKYADLFTAGTHGSTFGGNLLAAAVSNGVLDIMDDDFLHDVEKKGIFTAEHLKKQFSKYDISIRGKGLMIGIVMPENIQNSTVIKNALDRGLVLIGGGKDAIRFYPPLNVTEAEILKAINILEDSVKSSL